MISLIGSLRMFAFLQDLAQNAHLASGKTWPLQQAYEPECQHLCAVFKDLLQLSRLPSMSQRKLTDGVMLPLLHRHRLPGLLLKRRASTS